MVVDAVLFILLPSSFMYFLYINIFFIKRIIVVMILLENCTTGRWKLHFYDINAVYFECCGNTYWHNWKLKVVGKKNEIDWNFNEILFCDYFAGQLDHHHENFQLYLSHFICLGVNLLEMIGSSLYFEGRVDNFG